MSFTTEDRLKELGLSSEYEDNKLTILRLSYVLRIPFSVVEKKLYKKGYPSSINYETIVDDKWLPIILKFKSSNRKIRVHKNKAKKGVKVSNSKKRIPIRNWLNKKVAFKGEEKEFKKPIFISIPMGGKTNKNS